MIQRGALLALRAARRDSEEGLQPEFEVAHCDDVVDGTLAEFVGQGEDVRGDLGQAAILRFQAVQFQRLHSGRAWCPPTLDLLRVDIDELELLEMDPLDPIDGDLVQDMGLGPCFVRVWT